MLRRFLETFLFSIVFLVSMSFLLFFVLTGSQTEAGSDTSQRLVRLVYNEKGNVAGIFIRSDIKNRAYEIARKFSDTLYEKATLYNPEGDVLPDSVDDTAKLYLREKIL